MKQVFFLLVLALLAILFLWWLRQDLPTAFGRPKAFAPPTELVPFRIPGGTLHTNGFIKTETLHKETGSWLGTTASAIRLNATYRYEIVLRDQWTVYVDETRGVAFVVAPMFKPQLPVAVDSASVYE